MKVKAVKFCTQLDDLSFEADVSCDYLTTSTCRGAVGGVLRTSEQVNLSMKVTKETDSVESAGCRSYGEIKIIPLPPLRRLTYDLRFCFASGGVDLIERREMVYDAKFTILVVLATISAPCRPP